MRQANVMGGWGGVNSKGDNAPAALAAVASEMMCVCASWLSQGGNPGSHKTTTGQHFEMFLPTSVCIYQFVCVC